MRFDLPSNFEPRLKLYALDEAACAGLRRLWPSIEPALAQGIDAFIEAEKQMPSVAPMFQTHGDLIRRIEQQHFSLLLTGSSTRATSNPAAPSASRNTRSGSRPAPA
jgi:hypothetical protein